MKIHIHTLGCKVNQFESQALETLFSDRGHIISSEGTGCDAIIINTCAVTAESVRKSRQAVRHFKLLNPETIIGICGCWPQAEPQDAVKVGGDVVYGSGDRVKFADDLERAFNEHRKICSVDDVFSRRTFEPLPPGSPGTRTRALLKLEDGCVNFCTYCIIPYTRGPVRSLPMEEAVREAMELNAKGYKEIVLTGIEIASYGKDLKDGTDLSDVVCAIAGSAPDCRIRLGSLEPRVVTQDFCQKLSEYNNICPHFHLSLQSGCDATLARMKRKYDTSRFMESVSLLRRFFPGCGLTADLITGFPGETEKEFSDTLEFIEKCAFSAMHIFPYSIRKGTVAAGLEGKIEKGVKHERARRAKNVSDKCRDAFLAAQVGTVQEVLFEQEANGFWEGHCKNYTLVRSKGTNLHNTIRNVQITAVKSGILLGNIIL